MASLMLDSYVKVLSKKAAPWLFGRFVSLVPNRCNIANADADFLSVCPLGEQIQTPRVLSRKYPGRETGLPLACKQFD